MNTSKLVIWLSWLIVVLALVATGAGLFYQHGGSPFTFTTLRGQPAEIYGQGVYRYDTLFQGAGNKGTDTVTLFLAIPLLVLAVLRYRRGSLHGGLLLLGALTWFLYTYTSYALSIAYNQLFLVYVALFGASLWALVLTFRGFDVETLPAHFGAGLPQRGLASFMFVSGLVTLLVWLITPITALLQDAPPERLDTYTTLFTNALDMAIIVPITFIAGVLLRRRDPLGYLLVFPTLVLEALLAPMITLQTISQLRAGVTFPFAQIVGPIGGFATIAVVALFFIGALYRNISDSVRQQPVTAQAVHA